jgi:hypothetical protein
MFRDAVNLSLLPATGVVIWRIIKDSVKGRLYMRKRYINQEPQKASIEDRDWFDLEPLVQVELTSEDAGYPVEAALTMQAGAGWRAQQSGKQTIRLLFDEPHAIRRVHLEFEENDCVRTQEFVLRWSPDGGVSWQEIVRQQYNFSPPDSSREVEDYTVDIDGLTLLELTIIPDISGGMAHASLARLRLA